MKNKTWYLAFFFLNWKYVFKLKYTRGAFVTFGLSAYILISVCDVKQTKRLFNICSTGVSWSQNTSSRYSSIIAVTILATIQTTHKKYSSISSRDKYYENHVITFAESNINSCVARVIFHIINMLLLGNNALSGFDENNVSN